MSTPQIQHIPKETTFAASDSAAPSARRLLWETVITLVAAIGLTAYFTYPFVFQVRDHLVELGDSKASTYVHAWVAHALLTNPRQLWNTNIFYPAKNTLACSENWLGDQLFFLPAFLLSENAVFAHNFVILSSFVLSATTMYLLIRILTGNILAAWLAGFIYAFEFPRLAALGHMQLLNLQWTPPVILFAFLFLRSKRTLALVGAIVFLVLQVLCSLYLGYLSILMVGCYLVGLWIAWPELWTRGAVYKLLVAGAITALLLIPVVVPYLQLENDRTIDPAAEFRTSIEASADPLASYLDVQGFPNSIYAHLLERFRPNKYPVAKRLFLGFIPISLCLLGALRLKSLAARENDGCRLECALIYGSILLVACSYILSLGPYLHLHDRATHLGLPFLILRRIIPGLGVFRVPARFGLAMIGGVAILASAGFRVLADFCDRLPYFRTTAQVMICCLLSIGVGVEFNVSPYNFPRVMDPTHVAPEYKWLAAQTPGSVTVELPTNVKFDPYEQAAYIFASIYHWQPLINGYTSHPPPISIQTLAWAAKMPSADSIHSLQRFGVRYAVVHRDRLDQEQAKLWSRRWPGLVCVADFGVAVVYRFEGTASPGSPR